MKKATIVTALVSGLAGFVAGNAFWYLASPLWIDNVVQEALPNASSLATLKQVQFTDADASHKGSGNAALLQNADGSHILRFSDFTVTNGPDLKVYLVEKGDSQLADDVNNCKWFSLGRLRGNIGDQNYFLPTDINPAQYNSMVIWCEQFGVLFSAAEFR